jgi:predicted permease
MSHLAARVRYALRQFRLSPGFTAAAIATLALGIGGTTAIFTLIDAVMLRSLPVADPASLYRVGEGDDCCVEGGPQQQWGMYSFPLFERLKSQMPEFAEVTAFQAGLGRVSARRQRLESVARSLRSEYVTGNYFSTFGIGAFGGRLFVPADDVAGASPVAIISYHTWQTTYGGETSVVGSTFVIEGHPFTIVGVSPPGFFGDTLRGDPPDVWLPLHQEPLIDGESDLLHQSIPAWLRVIGRLRPGASSAGMGPRLTGILRQWMRNEADYPANWRPDIIRALPRQMIHVIPAGSGVAELKEGYGRSLRILFAVCAAVLLIACANVANLLLVRFVSRRPQTALRLAVGATSRQIVGQALAESILLSLGGGVAGLLVAFATARLLLALAFSSARFLPISVTPSLPVLAFACGVSLLTGIIFGAGPAWLATRTDPAEALRGQSRGGAGHSSSANKALVILQATLSVVLVAGAAMLARSLSKLEHQDLGYQIHGRVLISLNRPPTAWTLPKLASIYRQLETRLNRLPGVRGSGLALYNPLTNNWGEFIMVAGHPPGRMNGESGASWDRVSAAYLRNFGIPILRGRDFTGADNENTQPVAIVNQTFVKRFFRKDENPLDQHFGLDMPENAGTFRVIGVARDAKFAGFALRQPARPMFFVPLAQNVNYKDDLMKSLELRTHFVSGIMLVTNTPPGALEPMLTKTLADVDPTLTIVSVRTMEQQVSLSFDRERSVSSLAGLFGIVALLLAGVGMYGVTAYAVARRTAEIGIRMALGATRAGVMSLILRGACFRVIAGLLAGVPLAIGAGHLISAELYGVSSWDPLALSCAAMALIVSALFAALIPARRAASVSPSNALRTE